MRDEPWANLTFVSATVTDGVVHLWGIVASVDQVKALRIAAELVAGVIAVEDHVQPAMAQLYWAE